MGGRYVDWVLTTPLMLWDILALAGAPSDEIAMVVIMDMLMIGFGCAGAQTPDQNKWFFFIFGMVTFIHICAVLLKYSKVNKYGEEARALYNKVAWKHAYTQSWMYLPNASSESSLCKHEELLKPSTTDTNQWMLKLLLVIAFSNGCV